MNKVGKRRLFFGLIVLLVVTTLQASIFTPLNAAPQQQTEQQTQSTSATCAEDLFVQSGDTLSIIAGRVLGSVSAYQQIVDATNAIAETDSSYAAIRNINVINVG